MSSNSAPERAPRHKRPWSLAARLTAWYAASAFTLILVATGSLYWGLITNLDQEATADGLTWRRVAYGTIEGWVAAELLVPQWD